MEKYTGRTVDIIYMDRYGRFTQRRIRVVSVRGDRVRAYDFERRAPRVFLTENILAVQPAVKPA